MKQRDMFADVPVATKRPRRSDIEYRDAYIRGIKRAAPTHEFVLIGVRLGSMLGTVAAAHSGGLRGAALLDWIEEQSYQFRLATANEPQYWSGWQPFAFAKWKNIQVANAQAQPKPRTGAPSALQPLPTVRKKK